MSKVGIFGLTLTIEGDEHLHRCIVYIDLNMVRAGVVRHPAEWEVGGYREIQNPRERYALIDLTALTALCGFRDIEAFQQAHRLWVREALRQDAMKRDERWSESLAVGSQAFVESVKRELALKARHRAIEAADGSYALKQPQFPYTGHFDLKSGALRLKNTVFWGENIAATYT